MTYRRQVTGSTYGKSVYPAYDAADLGFRGYWYPVLFSHRLGKKAVSRLVCGEEIAFFRDQGKVFALRDRCPHRGIPLSIGVREFPGTITCRYHGWVYDLNSGNLLAALTDGPDSPIVGAKPVCVRTFPAEELAGLVFVFIGDGPPPPLKEHVPDEFMQPGFSVFGRITERQGDWRYAVENGYDEGHAKYLHRTSPWTVLRYLPAWSRMQNKMSPDGKWLTRDVTDAGHRTVYPNVGPWPKPPPIWKKLGTWLLGAGTNAGISVRLPGLLKVEYGLWWEHVEWYVPTEVGRHRYVQIMYPTRNTPWRRFRLWAWYWLYLRWMFHIGLFNQDLWMIHLMRTPPEQLYRPDTSIVGWRRMCEETARRQEQAAAASQAASPPASAD